MFQRPGEREASAFGVSFDTDRDTAGTSSFTTFFPVHHDRNSERAGLSFAEQRRALPIYEHRTEILYLVENHATTVIVGETGSGKTTQLPQYLYEAGWTNKHMGIACTQPRRVAAMTVAARVAEEMGCSLGREVGYAVRFEDVSTPGITRIKFLTDGVLLREMMSDPLLMRYSVVMVDEAHERSLTTDVLLGLLKKIQKKRPELRIIVSSATIQAETMAEFFGKRTAMLTVQGRTHSVQIHYLTEPTSDYVRSAVETAVRIHQEDIPGDILMFLTGQEECEKAASWLREEESKMAMQHKKQRYQFGDSKQRIKLLPCTLYAGLPAAAQLTVFEPTARGHRKVVVATNIAETSVTIQGIVYVIDSLYAKQRCFNPITGLESLLVAPISKASAAQRAGRAGRIRPGHAFRLCTEEDFEATLQDVEVPEMQRSSLDATIIQLKSLGIDNVMSFHWLAPPPAEAMIKSLESLHALGAIGNDAKLTQLLGMQMAELPLDPCLARALLAGAEAGCAEEAATLIAMLGVQSIWSRTHNTKLLDTMKAKFAVAQGDLLTYLNVWQAWVDSGCNKKWSYSNYVSHRSMLRVMDVRVQLLAHLKRLGIRIQKTLEQGMSTVALNQGTERLIKAMVSGLFMNAVRLSDEEIQVNMANEEDVGAGVYRLIRGGAGSEAAAVKLRIHPSSVLFRCKPRWACFVSAQQTDSGWYEMQELVVVKPEWLTEIAPHFFDRTSRLAGF